MGDGFVDAFALGAAMGTELKKMRSCARGEEGMRTPKVGSPAVTSGARGEDGGVGRGRIIVRGPGQNAVIRGL